MESATTPPADVYEEYLASLIGARLLIPSGVPGVYGLAGAFEQVVEGFEAYVTRMGAPFQPEVMRFPPILARANYERTDHLETFPNLMGSVHSFVGDERGHAELCSKKAAGDDWTRDLCKTDVMMTPAAC